MNNLPSFLKLFFWDYDFTTLSMELHRDFIIRRLLQVGNWEALNWLRTQIGDEILNQWIKVRKGAGLSPRQLRLWELVLDLPHSQVNRWVQVARNNLWEKRVSP